jgi:ribose 5-phosphate isomerase B
MKTRHLITNPLSWTIWRRWDMKSGCGTNGPAAVDYPDIAGNVTLPFCVRSNLGILVCGTGIGVNAANRRRHPRRVCTTEEGARASRAVQRRQRAVPRTPHLDAGRILRLIDTWLATPFSDGERHKRIAKMG